MQNNAQRVGRLYSLRTAFKRVQPAGRPAAGRSARPTTPEEFPLIGSSARITAGTLIALDGAQLIDILAHEVLVLRLKRATVEGFLDIFQRIVEIFLGGHFARTAGLR